MSKIKVMSIFGTRPEAIKMAPLIKALEKNQHIESIVTVTAQHREMLDQVLNLFSINPKYDLNIMKSGQTLTDITSRILYELETILQEENPDIILVHGDTSTTFAASLAAFYQQIPIGHVEAGLRTYNKYSPYPEEINRKLTTCLADLHFVPTQRAKGNLIAEQIKEDNILVTGNTVVDALLSVIRDDYVFTDSRLNNVDYESKKVVLVTAHRRENLGEPMVNIFSAIADIVSNNGDIEVILPMHKNPKVRKVALRLLGDMDRVNLIEPLEYEPFANLMNKSYMILTDSGGIQEEAPALGKPVLVMRDTTERPEAVEAGTVKLIGTDKENIIKATQNLLDCEDEYIKMANAINPYGDGYASDRIVQGVLYYFDRVDKQPEEFK